MVDIEGIDTSLTKNEKCMCMLSTRYSDPCNRCLSPPHDYFLVAITLCPHIPRQTFLEEVCMASWFRKRIDISETRVQILASLLSPTFAPYLNQITWLVKLIGWQRYHT